MAKITNNLTQFMDEETARLKFTTQWFSNYGLSISTKYTVTFCSLFSLPESSLTFYCFPS